MKPSSLAAVLCLAATGVLGAGYRQPVTGSWSFSVEAPNLANEFALFQKGAGYRGGNAIRLACPPETKRKSLLAHSSQYAVEDSLAAVRVTARVRGHGPVWWGILAYDRDRHPIYPPGNERTSRKFTLKGTNEWEELVLEYRPERNHTYARRAFSFFARLDVMAGSECWIGEYAVEFIPGRESLTPGWWVDPKIAEAAAKLKAEMEAVRTAAAPMRAKYGRYTDGVARTERYETVPEAWKPVKIGKKDYWWAMPCYDFIIRNLKKIGFDREPLYRDAMIWLQWNRATDDLLRTNGVGQTLLRELPDAPVMMKTLDTLDTTPEQRTKNRDWLRMFDRDYCEKFLSAYGDRLFCFGEDECFLCGRYVFAKTLRKYGLPDPKNRDEAYELFRKCYSMTFDSVPERVPFRNLANCSPYLKKWASNCAAATFNPYVCAMGDRMGGNETGDCMGPNPPKFAKARGAARQSGTPWKNYQTYYAWQYLVEDGRTTGGLSCSYAHGAQLKPDCRVSLYGFLYGTDHGLDHARQKNTFLYPYVCGVGVWSSEGGHDEYCQLYDDEEIKTADPMCVALRDVKLYPSFNTRLNMHFHRMIVTKRDRGVSATPIAAVFDRAAGYATLYFGNSIWDFFSPTDLENTMFAFDTHVFKPVPKANYYATSKWGDVFDEITNDASADFLKNYAVVYPVGDCRLDAPFAAKVVDYVKDGGTFVVNAELLKKYPEAFGTSFLGVVLEKTATARGGYSRLSGEVVVEKEPFEYTCLHPVGKTETLVRSADTNAASLVTLNRVGKGRVIVTAPANMKVKNSQTEMLALFDDLMDALRRETLEIRVKADPLVEYAVNRSVTSWIVYANNNNGIPPLTGKFKTTPRADTTKKASLTVEIPAALGEVEKAIDWWTGRELPLRRTEAGSSLTVTLAGADCAAVEFVMEKPGFWRRFWNRLTR